MRPPLPRRGRFLSSTLNDLAQGLGAQLIVAGCLARRRQDASGSRSRNHAIRVVAQEKPLAYQLFGGSTNDADVAVLRSISLFERQSWIVRLDASRFGGGEWEISATKAAKLTSEKPRRLNIPAEIRAERSLKQNRSNAR